MKWLHPEHDGQLELSLEDVFILPSLFEGRSRTAVDLVPNDFVGGSNPIVASNMNAVTGKRMAETLARLGGIGVLPQDMSCKVVQRILKHVKNAPIRYDTALVVTPDATLHDVEGLARKRAHGIVTVVDSMETLRPIGIVTQSLIKGKDRYTPVTELMLAKMVTITPTTSNEDAYLLMHDAHVKAAPVVEDGRLMGVLTKDDAVRFDVFKPALDAKGRLMVAVALGISAEAVPLSRKYVDAGADVLVVDTAHGHQRMMLDTLTAVRAEVGPDVTIVAGNVATAEGTRDLIAAGADVVKVNVGPGAMCTTRMKTGVGRPSFSAVRACALEAAKHGKHVWADGGAKHPRDVALYLAAGASRVMIGTWLSGTFESPGDIHVDADGHLYKENYGMASGRAVNDRTSKLDVFSQAKKGYFREGISSSKIYIRKEQASVGAIVVDIVSGVQSGLTYTGSHSIKEFQETVVIGCQSPAGYHEGTPHGRVRK